VAAVNQTYSLTDSRRPFSKDGMKQLGIFDICRNNHNGNAQSLEASASVQSFKAEQRMRVFSAIRNCGGATCDELERHLGLSHQACSARCSELLSDGSVYRNGTRRTRSGRSAAILICTEVTLND
jgi:hypothetical protein